MAPTSPISEIDRRNVTLFCDLISGFPETLTRVNWYMDGNLLKELPDCPSDRNPYASNELCEDIDPSKLLLEHVSKLFHGNYSCEAANEAGWSQRSQPQELEIYCEYFKVLFAERSILVGGFFHSGLHFCSFSKINRFEGSLKFVKFWNIYFNVIWLGEDEYNV